MSSLLGAIRPTRVRFTGLVAAAAILLLLANIPSGVHLDLPIGISIDTRESSGRSAGSFGSFFAAAALIVSLPLAWVLAHRANAPRWRSALTAALWFDFVAVVAGSFLVAFFAGLTSGGVGEALLALPLGAIGLGILGVPMLALVFVIALAWVVLVRLAAHVVISRGA